MGVGEFPAVVILSPFRLIWWTGSGQVDATGASPTRADRITPKTSLLIFVDRF
jgi:hypothetical protein